ncbi:hypothetical protein DRN39_04585 [Thermococci archaeon]|nr:MAG: hypothetical protein DRN39_04585 [Thermococci archaeon]
MARGAPDWTGRINIALQELAEVTIRNKYGGGESACYAGTVKANDITELFSIAGKGVIYGGFITVQSTGTQRDDEQWLWIDGSQMSPHTFYEMNRFNLTGPTGPIPYLVCYDDENFLYAVQFFFGYTFETSCVVKYSEKHGRTPTVIAFFDYALV